MHVGLQNVRNLLLPMEEGELEKLTWLGNALSEVFLLVLPD